MLEPAAPDLPLVLGDPLVPDDAREHVAREPTPRASRTAPVAKSRASNGWRSSSDSPTPTSFTGRPSSWAIATAMPPFARAVELRQRDAGDVDGLSRRAAPAGGRSGPWSRRRRAASRAARPRAAARSRGAPSRAPPSGSSACGAGRPCPRSRRRLPRASAASIASKATAAGSASALRADEVRLRPSRPDLELLLRRRAERVRGRRGGPSGRDSCRRLASLPIVVVLPVPFTPTTRITAGVAPSASVLSPCGAARSATTSSSAGDEVVLRRGPALLQAPDDLDRGRHADVGGDQRLLDPLPGLVVGRIEEHGGELARSASAAGRERVAQAAGTSRARVLRLRRRRPRRRGTRPSCGVTPRLRPLARVRGASTRPARRRRRPS